MATKLAQSIAQKMKENPSKQPKPKQPKPPKRYNAPNAPSQIVKKTHLKDRINILNHKKTDGGTPHK